MAVSELLQTFMQWTRLSVLGSWASLIALAVGVWGFVRIRTVRGNLRRFQSFVQSQIGLHDVLHHVRLTRKHMEKTIARKRPNASVRGKLKLLRGLTESETRLENYLLMCYGIRNSSPNALLNAAKYYRRTASISEAIIYYERARRASDDLRHFSADEIEEYLKGLQYCYLVAWEIEEAGRIGRVAEKSQMGCCIPQKRIQNYPWLYCAGASAKFLVMSLIVVIRGSRKKGIYPPKPL